MATRWIMNTLNETCGRCGRKLTDAISIALGMGPECRGKHSAPSRRQIATSNRLMRGQAFTDKQPITFANMTYTYQKEVNGWISSQSGHVVPDESLKTWMSKNNLAIFPSEYLDSLKHRRDLLIETIQALEISDAGAGFAAQSLFENQYLAAGADLTEMINELHTIQDILDRESEDE